MEHLLYKDVFPASDVLNVAGYNDDATLGRLAVLRTELQHSKDPHEQALLHYEVGHWIERSQGSNAQAVAEYLAAIHLNPAFMPALDALVRIYEQRGSFSNLDRLYEIQAAVEPAGHEAASVFLERAVLRWVQQSHEIEIPQLLREALARDPSSALTPLIEWLGRIYDEPGLVQDAIEARMRCAQDLRLRCALIVELARQIEVKGECDKALAYLQNFLADYVDGYADRRPRWESVTMVLYEMLELAQRSERYDLVAKAAMGLADDAAQVYEGFANQSHGDASELRFVHYKSEADAARHMALYKFIAAHAFLAQYRSAANEEFITRARQQLDEAIAHSPEDAFLRFFRMQVCDLQQDVMVAGEDAKHLFERYGSQHRGPWAAGWCLRLAEVAQQRGDVETAKRALSEGLASVPNSVVLSGLLEDLLIDEEAHEPIVELASHQALTLGSNDKIDALRKAGYLAWRCLGDRAALERCLAQAADLSHAPADILREQWGWSLMHAAENHSAQTLKLTSRLLEHITDLRERSAIYRHRYKTMRFRQENTEHATACLAGAVQEALQTGDVAFAWAVRHALYEAGQQSDFARMAVLHGWLAEAMHTTAKPNPGARHAHLCARARSLFLSEAYESMLISLETVLSEAPHHAYARALYEIGLRKLGRNEDVVKFLTSLNESSQTTKGLRDTPLLLAALTAEVAGAFDLAEEKYKAIVESPLPLDAGIVRQIAARSIYRLGHSTQRLDRMLWALNAMIDHDPKWVRDSVEDWLTALWKYPRRELDREQLQRLWRLEGLDAEMKEWGAGLTRTPHLEPATGLKDIPPLPEGVWHRWDLASEGFSIERVKRWIEVRDACSRRDGTGTGRVPPAADRVLAGSVGMLAELAGMVAADDRYPDVGGMHRMVGVATKKTPTLKDRSKLYEAALRLSQQRRDQNLNDLRDEYAHGFIAASVFDARPLTEGWLSYLRKQVHAHTDDIALWEELRVLSRRSEAWDLVVEACDSIAKTLPSEDAIPLWLEASVVLHEKLSRPEDAVIRLERVLRVDPRHAEAFGLLHDAWMDLGDTRQLIGCVERRCTIVAASPADEADRLEVVELRCELARLYLVLGERAQSLAVLQQTLDHDPTHIESLLLAADIRFADRQWQEGTAILQTVLNQTSLSEAQRFEVSMRLASTLADKAGRYEEASNAMDEIAIRWQSDAKLDYDFWCTVARYRQHARRYVEAALAWRHAAEKAAAAAARETAMHHAEGLERAINAKVSEKALMMRCRWSDAPASIQAVQSYLDHISEPLERQATFHEYEHIVRAELSTDVTEPEVLRKLGHVATWQGHRDTVLSVMEVMAALGVMSVEEQGHFAELPRRLPEGQWIGLSHRVFQELPDRGMSLLTPGVMGSALLEFLEKCSEALAFLDPIVVSGTTQRLSPKQHVALFSELTTLCRPFGVSVEGAYLTDAGPSWMIPSTTKQGIRWTLGTESTHLVSGRQRFRVGKFALAAAHHVVDLVARTADESERILLAFAVHAGHVSLDSRTLKGTERFVEWIEKGLRPKDKKTIAKILSTMPSNPEFFAHAAKQLHIWCACAGALTACDMGSALEEVLGATVTRARTQGHPIAEAMIRFWISDWARGVRLQLGVGV